MDSRFFSDNTSMTALVFRDTIKYSVFAWMHFGMLVQFIKALTWQDLRFYSSIAEESILWDVTVTVYQLTWHNLGEQIPGASCPTNYILYDVT